MFPCLTVAMVFFGSYWAFRFLQTSDHWTFSQAYSESFRCSLADLRLPSWAWGFCRSCKISIDYIIEWCSLWLWSQMPSDYYQSFSVRSGLILTSWGKLLHGAPAQGWFNSHFIFLLSLKFGTSHCHLLTKCLIVLVDHHSSKIIQASKMLSLTSPGLTVFIPWLCHMGLCLYFRWKKLVLFKFFSVVIITILFIHVFVSRYNLHFTCFFCSCKHLQNTGNVESCESWWTTVSTFHSNLLELKHAVLSHDSHVSHNQAQKFNLKSAANPKVSDSPLSR